MVFEREKKLYTSQDEFIFFMNFLYPGKIFREQEPKMGNFDQNLDRDNLLSNRQTSKFDKLVGLF